MPRRLHRLPVRALPGGRQLAVAVTWRARLLGLAGLRALPARAGLVLPACRSVHTFGMRFALDLVWLGADGRPVRVDREVAPRRTRSCRRARAVVEVAAGEGEALAVALREAGLRRPSGATATPAVSRRGARRARPPA